jgi:hypothetical protein
VTDEERALAEKQLQEVGPRPKELELAPGEFERMSWPEQCDHLSKLAVASGNRYGGRPYLMMLEHPERDSQALSDRLKAEGWPPKSDAEYFTRQQKP